MQNESMVLGLLLGDRFRERVPTGEYATCKIIFESLKSESLQIVNINEIVSGLICGRDTSFGLNSLSQEAVIDVTKAIMYTLPDYRLTLPLTVAADFRMRSESCIGGCNNDLSIITALLALVDECFTSQPREVKLVKGFDQSIQEMLRTSLKGRFLNQSTFSNRVGSAFSTEMKKYVVKAFDMAKTGDSLRLNFLKEVASIGFNFCIWSDSGLEGAEIHSINPSGVEAEIYKQLWFKYWDQVGTIRVFGRRGCFSY